MTEQGGPEPTVPQPDTPEPARPEAAPPEPLVAWDAPAAAAAPTAPPPAAPLVAWGPPATTPPGGASAGNYAEGPPPFTVGALLSDTFARYGADLARLFLVSLVATGVSWLSSFASLPAAGSNPFVRPTGFVDVSGILGLVSFVLGIAGGSTLFALADGGRSVGLARAVRRGVERAGWLFLTYLLLGLAFFVIFLIAFIVIGLFAVMRSGLVVVPFIALFVVVIWFGIRVVLAMPATVADNLNSIEAIKLSWRVTKPTGVWARLIAAAFLLGLLFVPAAFGTMLLVFPAMFGSMFGTAGAAVPLSLVILLPALVFSIFTPLTSLLLFSAYRRLVPPFQPSWTGSQPPPEGPPSPPVAAVASTAIDRTAPAVETTAPAIDATPPAFETTVPAVAEPPATTSTPTFRVPRLGTAGKALLALALVADIAGVLAIPAGIGEMARFFRDFHGFPGFTPGTGLPNGGGFAVPGQVTFSADVDLDTCTASFPLFVASPSSQVKWMAIPKNRVMPQDEVFLRISRDGQELDTTFQVPGTYDCIGSEEPISDLQSGVYTYQLFVNGTTSATGTLIVQ